MGFLWSMKGGSMVYKTIRIVIICILFLFPLNVFSSSIKEDYELQERCGKSSEDFFRKNYGNGTIKTDSANEFWSYKNHYNKKMNKCFILCEELVPKKKELFDIHENNYYGYLIENDKHQVVFCSVLDKKCKSEKEWDLLVKPYMEE